MSGFKSPSLPFTLYLGHLPNLSVPQFSHEANDSTYQIGLLRELIEHIKNFGEWHSVSLGETATSVNLNSNQGDCLEI